MNLLNDDSRKQTADANAQTTSRCYSTLIIHHLQDFSDVSVHCAVYINLPLFSSLRDP